MHPVSELTHGQIRTGNDVIRKGPDLVDKEIASRAFRPYYPRPKPGLLLLAHGIQTALQKRNRIKEEMLAKRCLLLRS